MAFLFQLRPSETAWPSTGWILWTPGYYTEINIIILYCDISKMKILSPFMLFRHQSYVEFNTYDVIISIKHQMIYNLQGPLSFTMKMNGEPDVKMSIIWIWFECHDRRPLFQILYPKILNIAYKPFYSVSLSLILLIHPISNDCHSSYMRF